MSFFLGIDAGGTKTECVLADLSGTPLARGTGGPANLRRTPEFVLEASLREAVAGALETAGVRAPAFEAVCAGFAGASQAEARHLAERILARLAPTRNLFIVGDMDVALEAAVGAGRGVVLIAGTGSIAYGRNDFGQQARAGGHGPLGSDEGSAADIVRRALGTVLEGQGTGLGSVFRPRFDLSDKEAASRLLSHPEAASQLAEFFPVVLEVARHGDPVAAAILREAGDALAQLARTVIQALQLESTLTGVATSGGVFAASPEVADQVRQRLAEWVPQARVQPLTTPPAEGAVRLAQRLWLQQRTGTPLGAP